MAAALPALADLDPGIAERNFQLLAEGQIGIPPVFDRSRMVVIMLVLVVFAHEKIFYPQALKLHRGRRRLSSPVFSPTSKPVNWNMPRWTGRRMPAMSPLKPPLRQDLSGAAEPRGETARSSDRITPLYPFKPGELLSV
ncbi:MAG: hypothetical protein M1455_00325 [Actinobacteria bacterium]|nr:hypothetical protein [Actinomycetota bacterium]